jgi:hypothetical protein
MTIRWGNFWLSITAFAAMGFLIAPLVMVITISFTSSEFLRFPPEGFSACRRQFLRCHDDWNSRGNSHISSSVHRTWHDPHTDPVSVDAAAAHSRHIAVNISIPHWLAGIVH